MNEQRLAFGCLTGDKAMHATESASVAEKPAKRARQKGSRQTDAGAIGVFRAGVVGLVRRSDRDLTARQLAVLLTCYMDPLPQTVRGLAETLHISRPGVSRVLDRLAQSGLVRRVPDPQDRRSILVGRTMPGRSFLRDLRHSLADTEEKTH